MKENAQKAQRTYAKQFDKNRKDHKLCVGDRVLWFRPQDIGGEDRRFALPFIGPYIIPELEGLNNAYIRLEKADQEPFLVNVDQLSRCYAGLAQDGPLQFTHTVRPRRANRRRRAITKKESLHAHPHHQMTLRQTANLDFDGVTDRDTELPPPISSVSAGLSHACECVAVIRDRNFSCVNNIGKPVAWNSTEITPLKICCWEGKEKGEIKNVSVKNVNFSKIAKTEDLNLKKGKLNFEKEEKELNLEQENLDAELEDVDRRIWN
ncbi:MAG: hypothetical protein GY821_12415 [Gammaproteobacteria bacterium]|nr:hypothetical protein [Gammaproteobacteria bacterium]